MDHALSTNPSAEASPQARASARRPWGPWQLAGVWVLAAVVLAGAILIEQAARGPLDDPQPARQRPGILTPAAISPPAVEVGDDSPTPGFRTVVFFLRDGQYPALVQALRGWEFLGQSGRTSPVDVLAVSAREPEGEGVITPVGSDPTGSIARTFGMPVPRDGGPPVGYAIVDTEFRVRYATLDPEVFDHLGEVATMLEAVP